VAWASSAADSGSGSTAEEHPSGPKGRVDFAAFAARLKSCPFKTASSSTVGSVAASSGVGFGSGATAVSFDVGVGSGSAGVGCCAGSETASGTATGSGAGSATASAGLGGSTAAISGFWEKSVNAFSSSTFAEWGNRPNPERIASSATCSAFRHHGIFFSITYISSVLIPPSACNRTFKAKRIANDRKSKENTAKSIPQRRNWRHINLFTCEKL
jgi:hypothetical protein